MFKFVILAVCGLMCLTQATPAKLSKELSSAQEIERQHALKELQNFDLLGAFVKLVLRSPEGAVANVNELLTKNNKAGAEEVLKAFNDGLKARIFVINGDYIEIDRTAFGRMLFENTRGFLQVFGSSLQQRSGTSIYERKLQQYVSAIEFKQPLEQFTAVLTADRGQVGVRALSLSSIIDSIRLSISSTVSNIINAVASLIVNILTAIVSLINNVLAWLKTNISFLFTLLNPIGTSINNVLQQIINWISPNITNATSSREVSEVIPPDNGNIIKTLLNYLAQTLASIIKVVGGNVVNILTNVANFLANTIDKIQATLNGTSSSNVPANVQTTPNSTSNSVVS